MASARTGLWYTPVSGITALTAWGGFFSKDDGPGPGFTALSSEKSGS